MNMMGSAMRAGWLVLAVAVLGCGDDTNGSSSSNAGSGAGSTCGTPEDPSILTLSGVEPAAGSSVVNDMIVHRMTIEDAPGLIDMFTFLFNADHTAGTPGATQFTITFMQNGADLQYEFMPVTWDDAPGQVSFQVQERYQTSDGCFHALPEPVFSYAVTPGGGGGGGMGGMGQGGSGGSGAAGGSGGAGGN